ncbi:hypothetical protein OS493_022559 [Desmophyllum pertusum]|uniref:Fibronectin type-III domain-containing protein n=1 Tax=Desmophyllum pertusum TaxID=174260 RepID=A0A9W9ZBB0_9CNID|nr:hypothetical protein OS493_022559 [Desmophyllum pertusum]
MYVTYSIKVQAFTSVGPGPFSPIVNATTIQTAPDVVIERFYTCEEQFLYLCGMEYRTHNSSSIASEWLQDKALRMEKR